MKESVHTDSAPAALGPYSQAVRDGDLLFCSGQIGLDPAVGKLVAGGFEAQAERVMDNLEAVLAAAGASLDDALKLTVYVTDLADFPILNRLFESRFAQPYPARATVQVTALPLGALVEVDLIARVAATGGDGGA